MLFNSNNYKYNSFDNIKILKHLKDTKSIKGVLRIMHESL